MIELYRDFIDQKVDAIVNALDGQVTPPPQNDELYRDFLDRKFDDVLNAVNNVKVKTFEYTGNGNTINNILFPVKPIVVLDIVCNVANLTLGFATPIAWGVNRAGGMVTLSYTTGGQTYSVYNFFSSFNDKTMTLEGSTARRAFNGNNEKYTVYYI